MTPPLVYLGGTVPQALALDGRFPGRVGVLFGPAAGWKDPRGLPYALDNGRYPVWAAGRVWDEGRFWKCVAWAARRPYPPRWLVVPDVVTDAAATLRAWRAWHPRLRRLGWPLALAVQDGMTPAGVAGLRPAPDVIFVGGSFGWKRRTLAAWGAAFARVHVGRVNSYPMLWAVERRGCESSDGTGWWKVYKRPVLGRYLTRSAAGAGERSPGFLY